jgi:hypothetical protein
LIKVLQENNLHGKGHIIPIYKISLIDGSIIKKYDSCILAAQEMNISANTIWAALCGE